MQEPHPGAQAGLHVLGGVVKERRQLDAASRGIHEPGLTTEELTHRVELAGEERSTRTEHARGFTEDRTDRLHMLQHEHPDHEVHGRIGERPRRPDVVLGEPHVRGDDAAARFRQHAGREVERGHALRPRREPGSVLASAAADLEHVLPRELEVVPAQHLAGQVARAVDLHVVLQRPNVVGARDLMRVGASVGHKRGAKA